MLGSPMAAIPGLTAPGGASSHAWNVVGPVTEIGKGIAMAAQPEAQDGTKLLKEKTHTNIPWYSTWSL